MLILLIGANTAPNLPDLYVRDTLSSLNIPVAGIQGWDDDFMQTQTISFSPMIFSYNDDVLSADDYTPEYWCRRLSKIIVSCFFSNTGANAVIMPIYHDKNAILSYGTTFTITAISEMKETDYCSIMKDIETFGANKVSFKIVSISAGTVKVYVAGV